MNVPHDALHGGRIEDLQMMVVSPASAARNTVGPVGAVYGTPATDADADNGNANDVAGYNSFRGLGLTLGEEEFLRRSYVMRMDAEQREQREQSDRHHTEASDMTIAQLLDGGRKEDMLLPDEDELRERFEAVRDHDTFEHQGRPRLRLRPHRRHRTRRNHTPRRHSHDGMPTYAGLAEYDLNDDYYVENEEMLQAALLLPPPTPGDRFVLQSPDGVIADSSDDELPLPNRRIMLRPKLRPKGTSGVNIARSYSDPPPLMETSSDEALPQTPAGFSFARFNASSQDNLQMPPQAKPSQSCSTSSSASPVADLALSSDPHTEGAPGLCLSRNTSLPPARSRLVPRMGVAGFGRAAGQAPPMLPSFATPDVERCVNYVAEGFMTPPPAL